MRRALLLALIPLVSGCGTQRQSSAVNTSATEMSFTARFVEHTKHNLNGKRWRETIHGAFDWDAKKGWAEIRSRSPGSILRIVQVGDLCFRRSGEASWKRSRAQGLCDDVFQDPRSELKLLREYKGAPDLVEVVGTEELGGVPTTHYHANTSDIPIESGSDLWVDESGAARRTHYESVCAGCPNGEHKVSTRKYYDFGAEVQVAPPKLASRQVTK
jgi:hypothetical protein